MAERSGDTAFARTEPLENFLAHRALESGVALRFPPQSKMLTRERSAEHLLGTLLRDRSDWPSWCSALR